MSHNNSGKPIDIDALDSHNMEDEDDNEKSYNNSFFYFFIYEQHNC